MRSLWKELRLAGGDDATPYDTGEGGVDAIFSAADGESPAIAPKRKRCQLQPSEMMSQGVCRNSKLLNILLPFELLFSASAEGAPEFLPGPHSISMSKAVA
jgi:hypothetical protein